MGLCASDESRKDGRKAVENRRSGRYFREEKPNRDFGDDRTVPSMTAACATEAVILREIFPRVNPKLLKSF